MHSWYSGRFPGAHLLVRSAELLRAAQAVDRLGKPTHEHHLSAEVARLLPCVTSARLDGAKVANSCAECQAIQEAAARTPAITAGACSTGQMHKSTVSRPPLHLNCDPAMDVGPARHSKRGGASNHSLAATSCLASIRVANEWRAGCDAAPVSQWLRAAFGLELQWTPPGDVTFTLPSLLPAWALVRGMKVCTGTGRPSTKSLGAKGGMGGLGGAAGGGHATKGMAAIAGGAAKGKAVKAGKSKLSKGKVGKVGKAGWGKAGVGKAGVGKAGMDFRGGTSGVEQRTEGDSGRGWDAAERSKAERKIGKVGAKKRHRQQGGGGADGGAGG